MACLWNENGVSGNGIELILKHSCVYFYLGNENEGGVHLKWGIQFWIYPEFNYQDIGGNWIQ